MLATDWTFCRFAVSLIAFILGGGSCEVNLTKDSRWVRVKPSGTGDTLLVRSLRSPSTGSSLVGLS